MHNQNGQVHTVNGARDSTATVPAGSAADRLQELIEQVNRMPLAEGRELATDCIQTVLELYGEALGRMIQLVRNTGPAGQPALDALLRDKLIRSLLLVHNLHPSDLSTRLHEALQGVRPYMESHGGNIEVISLVDDVARLRFAGACKGCPSSAITMELAVRKAVEEACPDLMGLELESAETNVAAPERECVAAI